MLSDTEFHSLIEAWNLPPSGKAYIDSVRSAEPSRLVGSGTRRSSPVRFASQRMGRVIQAESATVEGAFVRVCEYYHKTTLEYWDQPLAIPLTVTNKAERLQRTTYTPDFLVLRPSGPVVVQCKPLQDAIALVAKRPHDWSYDGTIYQYKTAATYFAEVGLTHEVWIPDKFSATRTSNIDLLLAVRRFPAPDRALRWQADIEAYLGHTLVASIADICREVGVPDAVMQLRGIDAGWLYAPLERSLLSCPEDALVALDEERFKLGTEAFELIRTTHQPTARLSTSIPSSAAAEVMLRRKRELSGECERTVSTRTARRYRARLREMDGDVRALLPRIRSGNRLPRLSDEHERFLQAFISEQYATSRASSVSSSHLHYENAFNNRKSEGGFSHADFPVSLNTYNSRIKRIAPEKLALARGGKRAANAAAAPIDREYAVAQPRRAFECSQVDHYLGDRALVVRHTGKHKLTRRPWISILRDGSSGEVLALTVGFRSPSRKVLAELLRDCVRRHQRLPEMIASDCGSDFQSVFYESTLALYGVHKKNHPSGAPRFGGELERLFGTLKTAILWQGPGSTRNDARGRSVSSSHRSHHLAEQDLVDFYHELESAIFDQLNAHLRGGRLDSPAEAGQYERAMYPMSGIPVKYDFSLAVATSVDAPERSYKVDKSRGINVLGRWYWSPGLANTAAGRVETRIDPWDEHVVYARTETGWISCRSRGPLPSEAKDFVSVFCRTTLRLDTRAEQRIAQRQGDLSLARHLATRMPVLEGCSDGPMKSHRSTPAEGRSDADDVPAIPVSWSA